jgi:hypothetical protein
MRKVLAAGAAVVVLAGLAYVVHAQRESANLASYKNVNVNLGAVSTAAADEMCTQTGHPRLVCLADRLKADLAPDLRARLQLAYSTQDARKWSNFPPMGYRERVGPTLGDFTAEQLGLIKAMLTEAAGLARNEGYDELEQMLNADDFLLQETGEQGFSSSNFHIAFLGDPAATGTWELYFGGRKHLSRRAVGWRNAVLSRRRALFRFRYERARQCADAPGSVCVRGNAGGSDAG